MKKFIVPALAATLLGMVAPALAADLVTNASIQEALASPAASGLIQGDIKLYFSNERTPKIVQVIGEWKSNRRRNMSHENSQAAACHSAFASAVFELQKRAREEGGNAIVNIVSIDNTKAETSSRAHYICRVGRVMAAVALRGKIVKTGR